jgi:molybdopterin/thiamine biosynthesis adenylyltransferase/rhodanese-related sulfurtransferase
MARDTELPELTAEETQRYSRHLLLPPVGPEGQRKLKGARVLLVGAGGLGSPAALYLAAAGIGTLGVTEFDTVSESNLQRQVLYGTGDVGRPKLDAARERIADLNPLVRVEAHAERLSSANALGIVERYDVVLDGTDNFPTRYLVNDACVLTGRPYVYGSVFRFEGQASVFGAREGPCYRCLFPEPPPPGSVPDCEEGGVLGVLPGLVGVIQATEVLKLVLGAGEPLIGKLLLVDALRMQFRTLRIARDPSCPACGTRTLRTLIDYEYFCGIGAGAEPVEEITPRELAAALASTAPPLLLDVREPREWDMARIEGARLVPLGTLAEEMPRLDRGADIVVHCKSGARSANAVRQLRAAGFTRVRNLAGGIKRWSDEVDPRVPKY